MLAFAVSSSAALINFFVGIIALAVGVVGFWITIAQLARVKSVSKAQEEAIDGLKIRLAGFDAIQECAQAQIYLDGVRESVQKRDKTAALANYDRLALSLLSLSESGYVSNDISTELKDSAGRIGMLSNGLDQVEPEKISVAKQLETSRAFHALLMRVHFYIHREQ